jgi:hypothetical protein
MSLNRTVHSQELKDLTFFLDQGKGVNHTSKTLFFHTIIKDLSEKGAGNGANPCCYPAIMAGGNTEILLADQRTVQ